LERDKAAIYTYNTKTHKVGEVAYQHPLVDLPERRSDLIWSRPQNKLLGLRYDANEPGVVWDDPEMARLQKSIDAALPNTTNVITLAQDAENRALVFAHSDRDPGEYYLFDRKTKKLEALARTRSWIDPKLMAER
jgi:hypothetical protein